MGKYDKNFLKGFFNIHSETKSKNRTSFPHRRESIAHQHTYCVAVAPRLRGGDSLGVWKGIYQFFCTVLLALSLSLPAHATIRELPENREQMVLSFAPLVKKSAPAVVNIYTKKKVLVQSVSPLFADPFFQQFFGNDFAFGGARERVENSLGSGVIVSADGFIITNYHVIKESTEIKAVLADGREFDARVVAKEKKTDLVLLRINTQGEKLPYLDLADSDQLQVGDMVLAVGNPFGVGQTVTSGIVSAVARTAVGISDYQFFIQTDAAINPGNSGGALVDMEGKLVGVNTAIYSRGGGSNGIGFAIPSNMVRSIVQSGENGGQIMRPWIGLSAQALTQDAAKVLGFEKPEGVVVTVIYPGGPADKAGIRTGDVITLIDDHTVTDDPSLRFRVATYPLGKRANVTFWRNKKQQVVPVEMAAPPEVPARDIRLLHGNHLLSGAVVANISPALASELEIPLLLKGVIILEVKPQSVAARIGFKPGDAIARVNSIAIATTYQLEDVMAKTATGRGWNITFIRNGKTNTVQFKR